MIRNVKNPQTVDEEIHLQNIVKVDLEKHSLTH